MRLKDKIKRLIYRMAYLKEVSIFRGGRDRRILFLLFVYVPILLGSAIALIRWLFMGERSFWVFMLLPGIGIIVRHQLSRIHEDLIQERFRYDPCDPMYAVLFHHDPHVDNTGKAIKILLDQKRPIPPVGAWSSDPEEGAYIIDFDDERTRKGINKKKKTGAGSRRIE